MVMSTDQRLDEALDKLSTAETELAELRGKLVSARESLANVEQECRDKGVEPDKLDTTVASLETRYRELVETLEQEVETLTTALAPYNAEEA
jgi:chromosome segregation ATPase